jgi:hypothetical protein
VAFPGVVLPGVVLPGVVLPGVVFSAVVFPRVVFPTVVVPGVVVAALGCVEVVAADRADRRLPPVRASAGIAQASSPPLSSAASTATETARREAMASAREI